MRLIIQRVNESSVTVDGKEISKIGKGLCVLVGIGIEDTLEDQKWCANRIINARLWKNEEDKYWRASVKSLDYELLLFARFKGTKPDFSHAKPSKEAEKFFDEFVSLVKKEYKEDKIKTGSFGAYMDVLIKNDGPVTMFLDSKNRKY